MTAQATAPGIASSLKRWAALLPVRFDDRRFWPRAALGLALRWLVLEGEWLPLRSAVTRAVVWLLELEGVVVVPVRSTELLLGDEIIRVTVSCTHVEVFALVAPLLWDRTRSVASNVAWLTALFVGLIGVSVLRIDVAALLFHAGAPWVWAHDILLGVGYFVVLAYALRRGAWTRPERGRPSSPGEV